METLIAFAHIIGSLITCIAFSITLIFLSKWEANREKYRIANELSIIFGVKIDDLLNDDLAPKILQHFSEKYSSESFKNRLSDFCGSIKFLWEWLRVIIQVVVLGWVLWITFNENLENALYAWLLVGISFLFWIVSVIFSFICKLILGRYPGEAKNGRKATADWVNNSACEILPKF